MNILIEDLDEKTVEKLKSQAADKKRSLQADLKVIIEELEGLARAHSPNR